MDMGMMTLSNYPNKSVHERVIELLKKERGNPLSVEDISFKLKMKMDTVVHVIQSIQETYPLCEKNGKIYLPHNKMRWWLVAFAIVIVDVLVFCELIKYYNV
jgi:hypothetical protein